MNLPKRWMESFKICWHISRPGFAVYFSPVTSALSGVWHVFEIVESVRWWKNDLQAEVLYTLKLYIDYHQSIYIERLVYVGLYTEFLRFIEKLKIKTQFHLLRIARLWIKTVMMQYTDIQPIVTTKPSQTFWCLRFQPLLTIDRRASAAKVHGSTWAM